MVQRIMTTVPLNELQEQTTRPADNEEIVILMHKLKSPQQTKYVRAANLINWAGVLADEMVTTEKIADGAVTYDKLASDIILGGGSGIADDSVTTAKLAADSVTTDKILNGNVTTAKLADSNVTTDKLAADSVTTAKIADSNVTTAKLADESVTAAKLAADITLGVADDSVTTDKILNGNITTEKLAVESVTTAKLADGNVTESKLAAESVTTDKILNNSVTTDKILNGNVTESKLANNSVTVNKLATDSVTTDKILNGNVTESKLAAESVTTTKIADGNVTESKLANNSVTTTKIADGNVTAAKLANNSVTTTKIADGNVTANKLAADITLGVADNSVTESKLADNSVTEIKLADNSVTEIKLANDSVTEIKLANDSVTEIKLANDSVTTDKIFDGSVTTDKIFDGSVTSKKLADESVTEIKLANDSVTTDKIFDGSVTAAKLADESVTESKLASDSVTSRKLAIDSVTTDKIADESVTESKLAADSVTENKLADGSVTSKKLAADITLGVADDSITTDKIFDGSVTIDKLESIIKDFLKQEILPNAEEGDKEEEIELPLICSDSIEIFFDNLHPFSNSEKIFFKVSCDESIVSYRTHRNSALIVTTENKALANQLIFDKFTNLLTSNRIKFQARLKEENGTMTGLREIIVYISDNLHPDGRIAHNIHRRLSGVTASGNDFSYLPQTYGPTFLYDIPFKGFNKASETRYNCFPGLSWDSSNRVELVTLTFRGLATAVTGDLLKYTPSGSFLQYQAIIYSVLRQGGDMFISVINPPHPIVLNDNIILDKNGDTSSVTEVAYNKINPPFFDNDYFVSNFIQPDVREKYKIILSLGYTDIFVNNYTVNNTEIETFINTIQNSLLGRVFDVHIFLVGLYYPSRYSYSSITDRGYLMLLEEIKNYNNTLKSVVNSYPDNLSYIETYPFINPDNYSRPSFYLTTENPLPKHFDPNDKDYIKDIFKLNLVGQFELSDVIFRHVFDKCCTIGK